jgi:hypothetical protein
VPKTQAYRERQFSPVLPSFRRRKTEYMATLRANCP